ncbi:LytTR family transcriptional regulator DNA-binding domain-containing protein [Symbiobacterium thermophilum]
MIMLTTLLEIADLHHPDGLHGLSLTVSAGESLALVGSHGNGKDPLLRLLAGKESPSRGHVRICGCRPDTPEARAKVGFAGATWGLSPYHTVWETLALSAGLWSLPRRRAEEVTAALELAPVAHRLCADLSPGEAARLRIARALLHDPALLVLDEPLGDSDLESAEIIQAALSALAEEGKGILLTTFGHPRTVRAATRVCYLERGRLVGAGQSPAAPDAERRGAARDGSDRADVTGRVPDAGQVPPRVAQIAARRDERVVLFSPAEILYAYAQDKGVYLHTDEGDWTASFTLAELEARLAPHGFFRAHRGYLVNLAHVKEIIPWTRSSFSLRMKDGSDVPLSKHRVAELKELLGW